jgi:hypothetical protein
VQGTPAEERAKKSKSLSFVMAGHRPGHPELTLKYFGFSWMAVSSTAMTKGEFRRHFDFFSHSAAGQRQDTPQPHGEEARWGRLEP